MAQNEEFEGTEEEADSSNAAFCRLDGFTTVIQSVHSFWANNIIRSGLAWPLRLSHFLQSLSTAAIKTPAKIDNLTVHDFGPAETMSW